MAHKALIHRAAQGRDIELHGCIGFNRSAEKLEKLGDVVLPEIETFLCELGSSNIPANQTGDNRWLGLADVLHVYITLASATDRVDPGQFLLSLHGWLREETTRVVFVEWGPSQGPQRKVMPRRLRVAVERLEHAGSAKERDWAHRLLQFQKRLTERPRSKVVARR